MPGLIKRPDVMPEPELVELQHDAVLEEAPDQDRIKTKISDVIKNRVRTPDAVQCPQLRR